MLTTHAGKLVAGLRKTIRTHPSRMAVSRIYSLKR
jgi:hypothetical protein